MKGGASVVVGYTGSLTPEWDERCVPPDIADAVWTAITAVTAALAAGVTDANALRASMAGARNAILLWAGSNPGHASKLVELCEQLYVSLRVTVRPV